MKITSLKAAAIAGAFVLSATQAVVAAPITWATWSSNTAATAGSVNITYSGQLIGLETISWGPTATFSDGAVIDNAPPPNSSMVRLTGGTNTGTNSIAFSQTVVNPVFAIWSLGQPGNSANFTFDATPTFVAGGGSNEYGGIPISVSGNVVGGTGERNGSVIFYGSFDSISWTNPIFENYYGFTVGISGVANSVIPVPAAVWLFGTGLMAMVGFSRRKRAAA